jgi:hypothetical protein
MHRIHMISRFTGRTLGNWPLKYAATNPKLCFQVAASLFPPHV